GHELAVGGDEGQRAQRTVDHGVRAVRRGLARHAEAPLFGSPAARVLTGTVLRFRRGAGGGVSRRAGFGGEPGAARSTGDAGEPPEEGAAWSGFNVRHGTYGWGIPRERRSSAGRALVKPSLERGGVFMSSAR